MYRFEVAMHFDYHKLDWDIGMAVKHVRNSRHRRTKATYLCVLELLLNVMNQTTTDFADEAPKKQFGSNLTGACNSAADAHQRSYLVCP